MQYPRWFLHLILMCLTGLAWLGILFIAYGAAVAITGESWSLLERFAEPLSMILTIVATAMVAASIYFFSPHTRHPELASRYIYSPVTILACVIALASLYWRPLSIVTLNGFAMLGLAGALLRLYPGVEPRRKRSKSDSSNRPATPRPTGA
jgi:hypothetical protein